MQLKKISGLLKKILMAGFLIEVASVTTTFGINVIDFEAIDGAYEGMPISNKFESEFGVTFSLEDSNDANAPVLAWADNNDCTAFHSVWGCDTPAPKALQYFGQDFGHWFLTDDGLYVIGQPPTLIVTYTDPVSAASGYILDIDSSPEDPEEWRIEARDISGQVFEDDTIILNTSSLGAGDGMGAQWVFDHRGQADIKSLRFIYTGGVLHVAGLAFDNFLPSSTPWCIYPPEGMVAWWPMDEDETPGGISHDIINDNDGFWVGSPTPIIGMVDGALDFNGISDYVNVPDAPELNFGTGDFSIDAWIRTNSTDTYEVFIDKRDYNAIGYEFLLYKGKLTLGLGDINGWSSYYNLASSDLRDGEWHFVVVTVDRDDPNGGKLYCDGELIHTFNPTIRAGDITNPADLWIGRHHPVSIYPIEMWFDGEIDEVELFNRTLTVIEVKAIFRTGGLGKCKDCNHNRIPDREDIANGTSVDCQHDGIPDECQECEHGYSNCNCSSLRSRSKIDGLEKTDGLKSIWYRDLGTKRFRWRKELIVNDAYKRYVNEEERNEVVKWLTSAVGKIVVLSPGQVWVDTFIGAMIIDGDEEKYYSSVRESLETLYRRDLRSIMPKVAMTDREGNLWILQEENRSLPGFSLLQYDGKVWEKEDLNGVKTQYNNKRVTDAVIDGKGNLLICNNSGIYIRRKGRWESILEKIPIHKLWVGKSGTLWAFGSGQLARFTGERWEVFSGKGRYADFSLVRSQPWEIRHSPIVFETPDGRLWFEAFFGDESALVYFNGKDFGRVPLVPKLVNSNNYSQVYAASLYELYYYVNGKWVELPKPAFSEKQTKTKIEDILVSEDGTLYVATNNDGLWSFSNNKWEKIFWDKIKKEREEEKVIDGKPMTESEAFLFTGKGPIPEELVDEFYKTYTEAGNKKLKKATDEQLAQDCVDVNDMTYIISYYRLRGRNEKIAQKVLPMIIKNLCSSDDGEGWNSLQIAGFGHDAVNILLKMVDTGTNEQRRIALNALGLMRDPNVVGRLLNNYRKDIDNVDNLLYVNIASAAVSVGNPKGMELFIKAATDKEPESFAINDNRRLCRSELKRLTQKYDDLPDDWSVEKWNKWWQKYRESWKPEEDPENTRLLQSFKSKHLIYQEVAKRLESK